MRSEWEKVLLGDITDKVGSGATPRGGQEVYKKSGISLIRSQNILDYSFSTDGLVFIDNEQAKKLKNVSVMQEDILLNITGDSVARACIVPIDILPARVNQHVSIIRTNDKKANYKYVFYFIERQKSRLLQLSSSGATRKALTKNMIESLTIPLPPLPTQKAIADTLSCLDAKIELNNKINQNLEAQAQAIFKSWFVDFEPFKDGEFVKSELGLIPKGWEVKELGSLFAFVKGKKPKVTSQSKSGILLPYLTKTVIDGNITDEYSNPDGLTTIEKEDVFMLMDGANSSNIYRGYDGILGSTFSKLEIYDVTYRELLYIFLKYWESEIKTHNTGSAIPHADKKYIHKMLGGVYTRIVVK